MFKGSKGFSAAEQMAKKLAKKVEEQLDSSTGLDGVDPRKLMEKMVPQGVSSLMGAAGLNGDLEIDEQRPPRVHFNSILENLKIKPNGEYWFKSFNAMFLPEKDSSGKDVNYGGTFQERVHVELHRNGTVLNDIYFSLFAERNKIYRATETNNGIRNKNYWKAYGKAADLQPGSHELVFKIDDNVIYTFPFVIEHAAVDDPYADPPHYVRALGLWDQYLGIQLGSQFERVGKSTDANHSLNLVFMAQSNSQVTTRGDTCYYARLFRDGVQVGNSEIFCRAERDWTFNSAGISKSDPTDPDATNGSFNLPDMKDGHYEIQVFEIDSDTRSRVDGAEDTRYEFDYQNGMFVLPPHMDLKNTGRTNLIDGGGNSVWLRPSSGKHFWV